MAEDKKESDDWIKSASDYLPSKKGEVFIKFGDESTISIKINKKIYINLVEFMGFSIKNKSEYYRFFLTDNIISRFSKCPTIENGYVAGACYRMILGRIHKKIGSKSEIDYGTEIEGHQCHILFSVRMKMTCKIENEKDDISYVNFNDGNIPINVWAPVNKNAMKFCLESIKTMDNKKDISGVDDSKNAKNPSIEKLLENKIGELDQTNNSAFEVWKWREKCITLPTNSINHGDYSIKFTRNTVIIYKLIFISLAIRRRREKQCLLFLANDIPSWGEDFNRISCHSKFREIKEKICTDHTTAGIKRFFFQCCIILENKGYAMNHVNFENECSGLFMFGIEDCFEITKRELLTFEERIDINKLKKSRICEKISRVAKALVDTFADSNTDGINISQKTLDMQVFDKIKNYTILKNVISEADATKMFKKIEEINSKKKSESLKQNPTQYTPPDTSKTSDKINKYEKVDEKVDEINKYEKVDETIVQKLILGQCVGSKCLIKSIKEDELHTFIRCASGCRMIMHFACWRLIAKNFDQICLTPLCNDNVVVLESRELRETHDLLKKKKIVKKLFKSSKKAESNNKSTVSNKNNKNICITSSEDSPIDEKNNHIEKKIIPQKCQDNKDNNPPKELVHPDKLKVLQSKKHATTTNTSTLKSPISKKAPKTKPLNLSEFRMMVPSTKDSIWVIPNNSKNNNNIAEKDNLLKDNKHTLPKSNSKLTITDSIPNNNKISPTVEEPEINTPQKVLTTVVTTTDPGHIIQPKPIAKMESLQIEGSVNKEPGVVSSNQIEGLPQQTPPTKKVASTDNKSTTKLVSKGIIFVPSVLKNTPKTDSKQNTQQITQPINQNPTNQSTTYGPPIYQPLVYQTPVYHQPTTQYLPQYQKQFLYYQNQPQINFQLQFQYAPFSHPQYQQQF